jgi:alpha-amylase
MHPIFDQLKARVLEAERDPAVDTGPAAVALLREWLANHEATVAAAKVAAPTEFNGTMMQWFHWYSDADGGHWRRLKEEAPALAKAGITDLWLPPAYKGGGEKDMGYGSYDLFDLGEFNQKKTVRTRWGTHDEYLAAVKACQEAGMQVYADVVFNHKTNGDGEEKYLATPFDPADRNRPLGEERMISSNTLCRFGRTQALGQMEPRTRGHGRLPSRCDQAHRQRLLPRLDHGA